MLRYRRGKRESEVVDRYRESRVTRKRRINEKWKRTN